jgi:hypothetical protein
LKKDNKGRASQWEAAALVFAICVSGDAIFLGAGVRASDGCGIGPE